MRKKACDNINAFRNKLLIATILFTGLFVVSKIIAQDINTSPYWQVSIKKKSYRLGNTTNADTILLTKKQRNLPLTIAYKTTDNTNQPVKKIIIVMTSARQEISRYEMVNDAVTIPLISLINAGADKLVSINVVQQPTIGNRARVGTKLLCYLKW